MTSTKLDRWAVRLRSHLRAAVRFGLVADLDATIANILTLCTILQRLDDYTKAM
ncbi:MAG: hypothetical protein ACFHWZ_15755 [Phycisphaerales bacterium]